MLTRFRVADSQCEIGRCMVWMSISKISIQLDNPVEEVSDPHCKFAENPR